MSVLEDKYNELVSRGWAPAGGESFVEKPVGDGLGTWFNWSTVLGFRAAVYFHPDIGAHEVHGAILDAYLANNGPRGALGYPTTDEQDDPVGRDSEFVFGSIFWASGTGLTTVMVTGPATAEPIENVKFQNFLNSGVGLSGRPLGPTGALFNFVNAVELQFQVNPEAYTTHGNLRPVQWAGPEAVWVKQGDPVIAEWSLRTASAGTGDDSPSPDNIFSSDGWIAYDDNPGPNTFNLQQPRCSRAWAVQNFTGWIVGDPLDGGATERLTEAVAWFSLIELVDFNWSDVNASFDWQRLPSSASGLGWRPTSPT